MRVRDRRSCTHSLEELALSALTLDQAHVRGSHRHRQGQTREANTTTEISDPRGRRDRLNVQRYERVCHVCLEGMLTRSDCCWGMLIVLEHLEYTYQLVLLPDSQPVPFHVKRSAVERVDQSASGVTTK